MLPVFPDVYLVLGSFLITISSTDLALLSALVVLKALAYLLARVVSGKYLVFYFLFS